MWHRSVPKYWSDTSSSYHSNLCFIQMEIVGIPRTNSDILTSPPLINAVSFMKDFPSSVRLLKYYLISNAAHMPYAFFFSFFQLFSSSIPSTKCSCGIYFIFHYTLATWVYAYFSYILEIICETKWSVSIAVSKGLDWHVHICLSRSMQQWARQW